MLQTITCVMVLCDQCGDGWGEADYRPHFGSESEAVQDITEQGWEQPGEDRRWLCRSCAERRHCQLLGHVFSSWHPCGCGGQIITDPKRPDGACAAEIRWCHRCMHSDRRPDADTTAAVSP
jgi:hypothetical protein